MGAGHCPRAGRRRRLHRNLPAPAGTAWSADKELGGKGVTQPGLVPATRYCLPGDVVECEVEGIGILRNPVAEAMAGSGRVAAE